MGTEFIRQRTVILVMVETLQKKSPSNSFTQWILIKSKFFTGTCTGKVHRTITQSKVFTRTGIGKVGRSVHAYVY